MYVIYMLSIEQPIIIGKYKMKCVIICFPSYNLKVYKYNWKVTFMLTMKVD